MRLTKAQKVIVDYMKQGWKVGHAGSVRPVAFTIVGQYVCMYAFSIRTLKSLEANGIIKAIDEKRMIKAYVLCKEN